MKKILSIIFLTVIFTGAFSQEGYRRGYVITYKKDTIRGKIKDRKYYNSKIGWQKINFLNEKTGEKDKYTPDDIWGYLKDKTEFRSLALGVEGTKRFSEIIENGPVILFAYSLGLSPKAPPDFYLQKANDVNSLMEWRDKDYKATAKYFFKGDTALLRSIDEEKIKYEEVQRIVKEYNDWKIKQ